MHHSSQAQRTRAIGSPKAQASVETATNASDGPRVGLGRGKGNVGRRNVRVGDDTLRKTATCTLLCKEYHEITVINTNREIEIEIKGEEEERGKSGRVILRSASGPRVSETFEAKEGWTRDCGKIRRGREGEREARGEIEREGGVRLASERLLYEENKQSFF